MKTKKLCLLALGSVLMLASCGENNSSVSSNEETSSTSQTTSETSSSESSSESQSSSSSSESIPDDFDCISVAEALEIAKQHEGTATTERYYIYGKITEIENYTYGSMTIQDDTGSIYAYGTYGADGVDRYSALENKPQVGDEVILYSTLCTYNGTQEIKSGWIVWQKTTEKEFDDKDYASKTIAEAREMETGSLVKVSGVVARITYANGQVPSGFYVIDNTSSIYIHSSSAASNIKEGNKITVCGAVDFWILDSEKTSASKIGYKGSCQLSDVTITENDNLITNVFDKSWIEETTIKNIMETSATENITNKIYKVNSCVKKVEGSNFINYYFDDIDGVTGSYTYTQCNGKDFSWLDEFDGKICTVYLTAINAKSSSSGAIWRFMPIEVIDENYTFDTTKTNEFIWEYHVKDLFRESYTGDPMMEVPTSISSEILGFENATITYSSSNADIAYFVEEEGKTIFHTGDTEGVATITINIDYGTNPTLTKTLNIGNVRSSYEDALTVKEAIDAESDEEIIVKGIAGPSLVNKTGFYLIDETGVIAITTTAEEMEQISLGNEVVFKGTRTRGYGVKDGYDYAGQSCLTDSTLVTNLYGKHEYSRDTFITGKTLADLYALDATVDYSTNVYTVKAKLKITDTGYYTSICLYADGVDKYTVYCSSANQYNWLSNAFEADTELTLDIAPVNWNNKKFWAGCVLSATDGTTRIDNALNYKN